MQGLGRDIGPSRDLIPLNRMPPTAACSIALQICSSAAPQLESDTMLVLVLVLAQGPSATSSSWEQSTTLSSHNFLKPACQHHPSMGSLVAPFPCTSNRRVGCSGRFLCSGVSAGESLLLRRVSC